MRCSSTGQVDAQNETLPSSLSNLINDFYGNLTKRVEGGKVVWDLPCDLSTGLDSNPRLPGEGLACYLKRLVEVSTAGVPIYKTRADMEAVAGIADGNVAWVERYATGQEWGGPLLWRWSAGSMEAVSELCRKGAGGSVGRWKYQPDSEVDPRVFGAKADGVSNDTAALQAALDYAASFTTNRPYLNLKGKYYKVLNTLTSRGVSIFGNDECLFPNRRLVRGNVAVIEDAVGSTTDALLRFTFNSTAGGNPINESPTVRGVAFLGHAEANPPPHLVTLTTVTSRTQMNAAPGSLPSYAPAGNEPYYGWCFFYSPEGRYLGSGMVQTVNNVTGQFTLVAGTDNYATLSPATTLSSGCKVAFPRTHSVTNYSGAVLSGFSTAKAGRSAISFDACSDPAVQQCFFYKWHCAVVSYASDGLKIEDVETQGIQYASIASGLSPYDSDWRIHNCLLIGRYVSDYVDGWPAETGTWTPSQFRTQVAGVDNWPVQSYGGHVVCGPGIHAIASVLGAGSTIHDLNSEGNYREAVRIYRGASSVPVGYLDPMNITTLRVHDSVDALPSVRTSTPTAVVKLGPWARLFVDHLSVGRFPGAAAGWVWDSLWDAHSTADFAVGQFEDPLGMVTTYRDAGANLPRIESPSVWTMGSTNYAEALKLKGGASGVSILEMERPGVGTWGMSIGTSTLNFRFGAGSGGVSVLGLLSAGSVNEVQFGGGSGSATPGDATIRGSQAAGTDIAGKLLRITSGRGTGAGSVSNAIVAVSTPTATTSGATLQTNVDRVYIDEAETADQSPLRIRVNGAMVRVVAGAPDSGGTGFRALRIAN